MVTGMLQGIRLLTGRMNPPDVFVKGGFDVVIGNLPYVHLEQIKTMSKALEQLGNKTFNKPGDLYTIFVEKGIELSINLVETSSQNLMK